MVPLLDLLVLRPCNAVSDVFTIADSYRRLPKVKKEVKAFIKKVSERRKPELSEFKYKDYSAVLNNTGEKELFEDFKTAYNELQESEEISEKQKEVKISDEMTCKEYLNLPKEEAQELLKKKNLDGNTQLLKTFWEARNKKKSKDRCYYAPVIEKKKGGITDLKNAILYAIANEKHKDLNSLKDEVFFIEVSRWSEDASDSKTFTLPERFSEASKDLLKADEDLKVVFNELKTVTVSWASSSRWRISPSGN